MICKKRAFSEPKRFPEKARFVLLFLRFLAAGTVCTAAPASIAFPADHRDDRAGQRRRKQH